MRQAESLYYTLENRSEIERIVTNEQIRHAEQFPPERTRAKFRGKFIKKVNEGKVLCGVNWSYIQLYEPYQILLPVDRSFLNPNLTKQVEQFIQFK